MNLYRQKMFETVLRKLGFEVGAGVVKKQKPKEQANQSYSSGEYAKQGDQGSEFFNQAKQRGTLFGN